MKNKIILYGIISIIGIISCESTAQKGNDKRSFGEIAMEESAVPVRPGEPGKKPFWNNYAKRFIYTPAFDFTEVNGASTYRYELLLLDDSSTYSFDNKIPHAPLVIYGKTCL